MGQLQSDYSDQLKTDSFEEDRLYIPPEILVKIFSYLNTVNRGRVAQVCRAWRDITYVPTLWRHDEISRPSPVSLFSSYLRRGMHQIKSPVEPFDRTKWARQVQAFTSYCSRNRITHEPIGPCRDQPRSARWMYQHNNGWVTHLEVVKTTSKSVRSLTVRYTKWLSFSSIFLVITHECSYLVKLCIVNCIQRTTIEGHDFWKALRNLMQLT